MPRFSLKYPYFIIVCFLITCVLGLVSLMRMPVDLFPEIRIPVVVVATFYNGMPPEQVEKSISGPFERFFTLGSGIDHIESQSLTGVSMIKVYFQPGTDPDAALMSISNLAMADLYRLPPGTLPPIILKSGASSLPVCLVTLKAQGLTEAMLRDLGQFNVRNQIATIPGAAIPQPFGGKLRQIMIYVDPLKLEAHQLSVMDVVRAINSSTLILPAGDIVIGPIDYNVYSNTLLESMKQLNQIPLKTVGKSFVTVADVGYADDAAQIQTNIVRIDGQHSVYLPILKQGGNSNTIKIVDGIKRTLSNLVDVPKSLITKVVFDQSIFVKKAIKNLVHEGSLGLMLTVLMVFVFLGTLRATVGIFLSIPLSILGTFAILALGGSSINTMILGGLALAFSRLIDDSTVVLENIYRHIENGEPPHVAAEKGGMQVALPVLAATLTTCIVFFPVTLLYGVSKYLFSALALAVVISILLSYFTAMTLIPLYCSKFLKPVISKKKKAQDLQTNSLQTRFHNWFNIKFERMLRFYNVCVSRVLKHPRLTLLTFFAAFIITASMLPILGVSYFPRTDAGQFVINLKAPSGTQVNLTEKDVQKVEDIIRQIVKPEDLELIVSNIGITPGFSAIFSTNTASHTAFVQASLKENHKTNSYVYMERVRHAIQKELPHLSIYFSSGGLVDDVVNMGLPAPINIQITGSDLQQIHNIAVNIASKIRALESVSDVFIPQDVDAPALRLDVDRIHAGELGLTQKEVISNVITALTSNLMIAPNYWFDPKSGNDYMLTVQYPDDYIKTFEDLKAIPIRASGSPLTARLDSIIKINPINSSTVVSHYQLQRVIDIFVAPQKEDLGGVSQQIDRIIKNSDVPENVQIFTRGSVEAMRSSFNSFGLGFILSVILIYLVLVAQFKSFIDPFIIVLAVPPGLIGTFIILTLTGTTLNIMSLMGIMMLIGISVSNSILIVEFTHRLREDGLSNIEAVSKACSVRLRPILMTSLASIIGLTPMALSLGTGSEAYASLARVIIGGLSFSVLLTIFLVPAAYILIYNRPSTAEG